MSKLIELMNELCPNGVEFYKLIDVCDDIIVPMRDRPKDLTGPIPWCRIEDKEGQYFNGSNLGLGVTDETVKKMNLKVFPKGTVICSCSASIGAYAINTKPLITNQTFIGLVCGKKLNNKYLLYYMETQTSYLLSKASKGTIPYISRNKFEEMKVPVPPLEVQREIVHVLDSFTLLNAELKAELKAELTARKKQYDYYHDYLMDFRNRENITWCSVGEFFEFKNGINKDKSSFGTGDYIVNFTDVYNHRWITREMLKGRVKTEGRDLTSYDAKYGDIFFTRTSETKEDIGMVSALVDDIERCVFSGFVLRARPLTNNWLPKFCSYYFSSSYIRSQIVRYASFTTRALTSGPRLSKLEIPQIPIEEQQRIIDILDGFNELCSGFDTGIPAEIETRQKQYEYYRDRLLSFKELTA